MELKELFFLLGNWSGHGKAEYPSVSDTEYTEQLIFEYDITKDFIFYSQKTRFKESGKSGNTLHAEFGFIKQTDDGVIELSNSQNNGRVEVLTLNAVSNNDAGSNAIFVSKLFGNDHRMISTQRVFTLEGDILRYEMKMATQKNKTLNTHLSAELKREA